MLRVKSTGTRPPSCETFPDALDETDDVELLPRLLRADTRKRSLEDESIGNSSDTPLFSSDDHPASAENYLEPHSKRQRRGPWWGSRSETQELILRNKSKREFRRNFDSGVWMESDADLEDDIGGLAVNDHSRTKPLPAIVGNTLEDPENCDGPVFPDWHVQPVDIKAFWRTQRAAIKEISRCVDHNIEIVDLSHMGLFKLQESTLEPLKFLVAERSTSQPDAESQTFETLIPNLQLYLANNLLFQMPGQLFNLLNLTVLSLRQNNLIEIPSAIGDLVNLRELNVSNNRLRWLPHEVLQLLSKNLKVYRFHPNPFIKPLLGHSLSTRCSTKPSTKPAFFRIDGILERDSSPSPTTAHAYFPKRNGPSPISQGYFDQSHNIPSLFETSLRACSKSPELGQLPYLIPPDGPDALGSCLKRAWKLKQEGGQQCSVCKSVYIVPRTEWIEWWQLPADAAPDFSTWHIPLPTTMTLGMTTRIPFIRRGCSWSCISESEVGCSDVGWRTPLADELTD
ncbi:MAG: hypothetical protein Q9221_002102 [Calogaya cf. arnoldii]